MIAFLKGDDPSTPIRRINWEEGGAKYDKREFLVRIICLHLRRASVAAWVAGWPIKMSCGHATTLVKYDSPKRIVTTEIQAQ